MASDRLTVLDGLHRAHERLLEGYAGWGGHNHYGWIVQEDTRNFRSSWRCRGSFDAASRRKRLQRGRFEPSRHRSRLAQVAGCSRGPPSAVRDPGRVTAARENGLQTNGFHDGRQAWRLATLGIRLPKRTTRTRGDPNFLGRAIWTEADCVYRYAVELEKEFPTQVHFELNLGKATRLDYDPEKDRLQNVDIVVSDLGDFEEDETSMKRFQAKAHEAFIEAKWLKKGWWGNSWERDARKRVESIVADAVRLQDNLDRGRCLVAACLVFDDECFFEYHLATQDWPEEVALLAVSPCELRRRGMLSAAVAAAHARAEELAPGGSKGPGPGDRPNKLDVREFTKKSHRSSPKAMRKLS